jgi:hypothetical protein
MFINGIARRQHLKCMVCNKSIRLIKIDSGQYTYCGGCNYNLFLDHNGEFVSIDSSYDEKISFKATKNCLLVYLYKKNNDLKDERRFLNINYNKPIELPAVIPIITKDSIDPSNIFNVISKIDKYKLFI